ncbi:UNVERIFIED_CONTAM: hypothetical protein FKN15_076456 [Acipenser sinensis]
MALILLARCGTAHFIQQIYQFSFWSEEEEDGEEDLQKRQQLQQHKRWWSQVPQFTQFGPPDWATEQEQWRMEGASMYSTCGKFSHDREDCPYVDPQYEEAWNQSLVGDAAEWFWAFSFWSEEEEDGEEELQKRQQLQQHKRWWSQVPTQFGPPDWATEQEQWRMEGASMYSTCGKFSHDREDCPYVDPQYEEAWNQSLVGDAAEWFWAVTQTQLRSTVQACWSHHHHQR